MREHPSRRVLTLAAGLAPSGRSGSPRTSAGLGALLCLACLGAVAWGCQPRPRAELLTLEALEPDPGDPSRWRVIGQGFPADRAGEVTLSGSLRQPGASAVNVDLRVPCEVRSERLLTFRLAGLPALQGRGPGHFEGRLGVAFRGRGGGTRVTGSLAAVRLRIEPQDLGSRRAQLSLNRRAHRWHETLGLADLERREQGVGVVALVDDGPAARAGLQVGDVIQRVADAPVEEPGEVVPPPGVPRVEVTVRRAGSAEPVALQLPVQDGGEPRQPPRWGLVAVLALLGLLAAMLRPLRLRETPAPRPPRLGWLVHPVAVLLCAATVAASYAVHGGLELASVWAAPAGVYLVWHVSSFARGDAGGGALSARLGRVVAASLALAGLALLAGTLQPDTPLVGRQAWPWQWPLSGHAPAWLCVVTLAGALGRAGVLGTAGLVEATARAWLTWAAAVCVVALSAQGGQLPADWIASRGWDGASVVLASTALWLAKVAAMALGFDSVRRAVPASALAWAGAACPPLALAWLWWGPVSAWAATLGALASLAVLLGAARALATRLRRQALMRDAGLIPFL